jgi:hypothetical protein
VPHARVGRGPRRNVRTPLTQPGGTISCDRARPKQASPRCSRSHRKCKRYGFRLSWPRPNNRRRAVVCKSAPLSPSPSTAGQISDARFVHTSNWDIELHHSLTSSVPVRNLSLLSVPIFWNPSKLEALDRDLLDYCTSYNLAWLPTG